MRKNMVNHESNGYKIIVVDDEQGIVDSLSIFLRRSGYDFTGVTNPLEAIEKVRNEHFDLMILDFMMDPIHGDEVVEQIRKFNKELYILLLTENHKPVRKSSRHQGMFQRAADGGSAVQELLPNGLLRPARIK